MKFKKMVLVTCLLLAVLTMGAVSAGSDANQTLAVDDIGELSQDLDDESVSIEDSDVDELKAVDNAEELQNTNASEEDAGDLSAASAQATDDAVGEVETATIDVAVDDSKTMIVGNLVLTNSKTGEIFRYSASSPSVSSSWSDASKCYGVDVPIKSMVDALLLELKTVVNKYAKDSVVTIKTEKVTGPFVVTKHNDTNVNYYAKDDPKFQELINSSEEIRKAYEAAGPADRYRLVLGSYGKSWIFNATLVVELKTPAIDIHVATVILSDSSFAYNGKVQKPDVTVLSIMPPKILKKGVDYTLSISPASPKKVGKYTITIIGKGDYTGKVKTTYKINKAKNPLKIKAKTVKIKFSKLKNKAQKLKVSKVIKFVKKGQGTMAYVKKAGNKKITVNKKTGAVTIKKGLKKGTYKVKLRAKAKGNANYKASAVKTVIFKVKVV